jgi:quercetin dioxygenase-like cupin family protein
MRLTRWNKETAPSLEGLRSALTGEGLSPTEWTDAPGTVYPVQTHETLQVRWVLRGELRIGLPESGEEFVLGPGDRLDLPPNTPHWMDVNGASPAMYLTATKSHSNNHKK